MVPEGRITTTKQTPMKLRPKVLFFSALCRGDTILEKKGNINGLAFWSHNSSYIHRNPLVDVRNKLMKGKHNHGGIL